MALPGGEIEHDFAMQFVSWHLVGDYFLGSWRGLPDGAANAPEYWGHSVWLRGDVLVHRLEFAFCPHPFSLAAWRVDPTRALCREPGDDKLRSAKSSCRRPLDKAGPTSAARPAREERPNTNPAEVFS